MTRKLHNTMMAIIASSILLALGLIAGTPVAPSLHDAVGHDSVASLDEAPELPETASGDGEAASPMPRGHTRAMRGGGQSVSMPFFSFVPRG